VGYGSYPQASQLTKSFVLTLTFTTQRRLSKSRMKSVG
jgi:hypothetical protein